MRSPLAGPCRATLDGSVEIEFRLGEGCSECLTRPRVGWIGVCLLFTPVG